MKNIVKRLSWFLKKEWKTYLILFLFLLLIVALSLTPAYFLGVAIDTIISGSLNTKTLLFLVGALALIPTTRYFASLIYNYKISKLAQKLAFELREEYLKKLFEMDLSFYDKYDKGDLINRITSDLESITIAATNLFEGIVFNFGLIIMALILMIVTISAKLTLISVTYNSSS